MSRQLRVTQATVISAYRALVAEGLASKIGKQYRVGPFPRLGGTGTPREAWLLVRDAGRLGGIYTEGVCPLAYQRQDTVLTDAGFRIRHAFWRDLPNLSATWRRTGRYPHGCIMADIDQPSLDPFLAIIDDLLCDTHHPRVPVLIDTDSPRVHFPRKAHAVSRPLMQTQTVAALVERITAMRVSRVVVYGRDYPNDVWRYWEAVRIRSALAGVRQPPRYAYRVRKMGLRGILLDNPIGRAGAADLLGPSTLERFGEDAGSVADTPSLLRTIDKGDCVVCQYEEDAAELVTMARERRIDVGGDIAVVGMENDPAHFHLGISSCILDWDTLGYLMGHAIIGDVAVQRHESGFIACRGRFVERLTA